MAMNAGVGPDRNSDKLPILPQRTKVGDAEVRPELITSLDELDWYGPEDVHTIRCRKQRAWGKP